jgi:hypothetical protein
MSRGQSAEKSLLKTFIKPASSFQPASVLSNHDVGTFSSKQYLSDEQKYQLLRNHFIPKKTYEFPAIKYGGRNRTFQCSCLEMYRPSVFTFFKWLLLYLLFFIWIRRFGWFVIETSFRNGPCT